MHTFLIKSNNDFDLYLFISDLDSLITVKKCNQNKSISERLIEVGTYLKHRTNCCLNFFKIFHFNKKFRWFFLVLTATPERMIISILKRIKNYLRNATTEDILTGLSLLNVYKNIHIDPVEVINCFIK